MSEIVISSARLRPRSLPGGPGWVERSGVSTLSWSGIAKCGLLAAGVFALGFGIALFAADNADGLRAVLGGICLLGWGYASPMRYSVDLHGRGAVRSLLTTHDPGFAGRIVHLINDGLANPAAMPTYRVDPKRKTITID